jgi:hypothetical protein
LHGRLSLHHQARTGANRNSGVARQDLPGAGDCEPDPLRGGVFLTLVGLRSERARHSDRFHQRLGGRPSGARWLPAQAYDWDIQKQVEVAKLGQDFVGYFAWHYPPPFLFVASLLAQLPYQVAFIGWVVISFLPFLVAMRAIVGRNFGYLLAFAIPMAFINALVGQNGFLTAPLIGGTLYLIPVRPVLAGICLGLLTYKPQYGLLFPIMLIAGGIGACSSAPA